MGSSAECGARCAADYAAGCGAGGAGGWRGYENVCRGVVLEKGGMWEGAFWDSDVVRRTESGIRMFGEVRIGRLPSGGGVHGGSGLGRWQTCRMGEVRCAIV